MKFRDFERQLPNDLVNPPSGKPPIWAALRLLYFYKLDGHQKDDSFTINRFTARRLFRRGLQLFWGFRNWFTPASIWIFTNGLGVKNRDDRLEHPLFQNIVAAYPAEAIKYVEKPYPVHGPLGMHSMPNPVSHSMIDVLALLASYLPAPMDMAQVHALEVINRELGIALPVRKVLKRYSGYRRVFDLLLRLYSPKLIFLSEYYNVANIALLASARMYNVPTIEMQHGLVSPDHRGYIVFHPQFKVQMAADRIFVFGQESKNIIAGRGVYEENQIFVTGNPNLSPSKGEFNRPPPPPLKVLVTLQEPSQSEVIDLICNAAIEAGAGVEFSLLPRQTKKQTMSLPANVHWLANGDFYSEIEKHHWHCTEYSTCGQESFSFAVPTVFLDFRGQASLHYPHFRTRIPEVFVMDFDGLLGVLENYDPGKIIDKVRDDFDQQYADDPKGRTIEALKYLGCLPL